MHGTSLFSLVFLIIGIKTDTVFDDPLFKSTSPSDFWGRRWNKLVSSEFLSFDSQLKFLILRFF